MKMMPARVLAGLGQVDARVFLGDLLEEGVRHLHQDARAVAGVDLAAAGAAMIEILEDLDALLDDRRSICVPLMSTTKPTPQASCSN